VLYNFNLQFVIFVEEDILVEIVKLATLLLMLKTNNPNSSIISSAPTTLTPIQLGTITQISHGVTTFSRNNNHKRRKQIWMKPL